MRSPAVLIAAAALLGSGATAAAPAAKPQHVMSLNLCTDQLVLQLLPANRIASVSYLSQASEHVMLTAEAAHVPVNYGSPEEVLAEHPDLVIAGTTSTPATRALLKQVGIPLLEVPAAESFAAIRAVTRLVGHAVGEDGKTEALLDRMDATLAELKASAPAERITAVGWDGGGNVPGAGTLFDAILTAAGAVNIAAGTSNTFTYGSYTSFDLEQLVALHPDILLYGGGRANRPDQLNRLIRHRVVRKLFAGHALAYPEILYRCGLPQSAGAAKELHDAMLKAVEPAR